MKCKQCGRDFLFLVPCPSCGQMEPAGRPVCEKALAEARWTRDKYTKTSGWFSPLISLGGMIIVEVWVSSVYLMAGFWWVLFQMLAVMVVLNLLLWLEIIQKQRKRREFPEKFPREAEILRLAEGGEKK